MVSPLGAGESHGPLWWRAVLEQLSMPPRPIPVLPILDCGRSAGHAAWALRLTLPAIAVAPGPQIPALHALATQLGAQLFINPAVDLNLALRGARQRLPDLLSASMPTDQPPREG